MVMERLEAARRLLENQDPAKQFAIEQAIHLLVSAGVKDSGSKVGTDVNTPEAPVEIRTFSRDQLILPDQVPQYVSEVLQRAEKAGFTFFEPFHLSDATLGQDSNVEGWNSKPEDWYWEQIKKGNISSDASKLPGSWVLVDKTPKPDYRGGKQMYENDPLGVLLKQLRKDEKIQTIKGIPDTSRFGISHDELSQVVLPEIAKLLGVDNNQVRLPKEIEFNVIGNLKHPEWGKTDTWEWLEDKFEDVSRLFGGFSGLGGLAGVPHSWSDDHDDGIGFRPLVVISPKA